MKGVSKGYKYDAGWHHSGKVLTVPKAEKTVPQLGYQDITCRMEFKFSPGECWRVCGLGCGGDCCRFPLDTCPGCPCQIIEERS